MATVIQKKKQVKSSQARTEAPKQESPNGAKERTEEITDEIKAGAAGLWKRIKVGAKRVGKFAEDATELGKLKVEIHKLEGDLDKLFSETGRKIWDLYQTEKLGQAGTAFTEEFKQITNLQKNLKSHQQQVEAISLLEKKK